MIDDEEINPAVRKLADIFITLDISEKAAIIFSCFHTLLSSLNERGQELMIEKINDIIKEIKEC